MKKIIIAFLIVIFLFLVGCSSKEEKQTKEKETVSLIEIGKKEYIDQLKEITIKDTKDTIKITKEVKWEVPETEEGETTSFTIAIPYTIKVDEKEYKGTYYLGDNETDKDKDTNPKYDFKITNLTKEGKTQILITEK